MGNITGDEHGLMVKFRYVITAAEAAGSMTDDDRGLMFGMLERLGFRRTDVVRIQLSDREGILTIHTLARNKSGRPYAGTDGEIAVKKHTIELGA